MKSKKLIRTGLFSDLANIILNDSVFNVYWNSKKKQDKNFYYVFSTVKDLITGEICLNFSFADGFYKNEDEIVNAIIKDTCIELKKMSNTLLNFMHPFDFSLLELFNAVVYKMLKIDLGNNVYFLNDKFQIDKDLLFTDRDTARIMLIKLTQMKTKPVNLFNKYESMKCTLHDMKWLIDYVENGFKSDYSNELMGKPYTPFDYEILSKFRSECDILMNSLAHTNMHNHNERQCIFDEAEKIKCKWESFTSVSDVMKSAIDNFNKFTTFYLEKE